ncbi:sigma-54-dependent transcriptional regulator [Maribacter sp. MAR_2009_72]|uniref:sigma-54-dependent transcriptional regulator n=1 Tax=Maribacter sp. MAR_2009_72 TaxID=1250050 RepID=UPI00119A2CDD|nr:sigma-54 dependent transcriptional regulator [Maribacter sp. MAR_2009_72]TVZ15793.1 two-component system response regulator HydG [Maribacter sp. MAR_2009_72]
MARILINEDDAAFAQMLQKFLIRNNFEVLVSHTGADAENKIKEGNLQLVITDLRLPNYDGLDLVSALQGKIPIIVMTGYAEVASAVKAMKMGAYDYISKPFTPDQMLAVIDGALHVKPLEPKVKSADKNQEKELQVQRAQQGVSSDKTTGLLLVSDATQKLEEYISLVAPTDMSVLIIGESGTGKEVTAKAIHEKSLRKEQPFVALDCGAIPKELASSEFFGHLKGSFTGAIADKIGSFEAANGGTLFLDEVGNLSYENQMQLLRALQERKIKRIGSNKEINVDVRILSATNEDLKAAVEKGTFREDLYHRLNEFSLQIPALKDRHGDLKAFATYFLEKFNGKLGKQVADFSPEVWNVFNTYTWPGNIRELQNVIQRAVLLSTENTIEIHTLPAELLEKKDVPKDFGALSKADFEKEQIINALKKTNYNKSKAAKLLQVTRKTLYNRINYYDLDVL